MHIGPALERYVFGLADELRDLLKDHLAKDPADAGHFMTRAQRIKAEIESLGFLVEWSAVLDYVDLEISDVIVELYRPKDNLTPEQQKTYDEWLALAKKLYEKMKK